MLLAVYGCEVEGIWAAAMSIVPKDTIHVIAESIGISNLPDDVAAALAPDVEYRMREIMQVLLSLNRLKPTLPLRYLEGLLVVETERC